jgi:hypothetical protein
MIDLASGGVTIVRGRLARRLSNVAKGSFAAAMVVTYLGNVFDAGAVGRASVAATGGLANIVAFALMVVSYALWVTRTPAPGRVAFDGATLRVWRGGAMREVPRASVTSAYVVYRPFGTMQVPTVEIALRDGDSFAVRTETDEQAQALVAALGFGPGAKSVTIDMGSPTRRLFHPLLGVASYYIAILCSAPLILLTAGMRHRPDPPFFLGLVLAPLMLLAYRFLRTLVRAPRLTIGDDGVTWESGRKKRFVPRSSILGIEQRHPAMPVSIHTDRGPIVVMGSALDIDRRAAAARIAHARISARQPGRERAPLFDRAGRSLGEWREHLRRVLDDSSYRSAGASVDEASAVLSNPEATREQRVGAALALRVAGEPPERIRVAVAPSADDALREAVEAVADERADDARVAKVLRRID